MSKAQEVVEVSEVKLVTLKELCAELGIKPATARRKLRSRVEKDGKFRWSWPTEEVASVKEALMAKAEVVEEAKAA